MTQAGQRTDYPSDAEVWESKMIDAEDDRDSWHEISNQVADERDGLQIRLDALLVQTTRYERALTEIESSTDDRYIGKLCREALDGDDKPKPKSIHTEDCQDYRFIQHCATGGDADCICGAAGKGN